MKVILLADVEGTGKKYDVKIVSNGYGMNFLLPNKLAERATPERIKNIDELKQRESEEIILQENLLKQNIAALKKTTLEIKEKANNKGHLFRGVTKEAILKVLKNQEHIDLSLDMILLEKPIKEVGKYSVLVKAGDKKTSFKLTVSPL